jgi:hypothetical protein
MAAQAEREAPSDVLFTKKGQTAMGQQFEHEAGAEAWVAEDYAAQDVREDGESVCARCGAALQVARERATRLCGWCEETAGSGAE